MVGAEKIIEIIKVSHVGKIQCKQALTFCNWIQFGLWPAILEIYEIYCIRNPMIFVLCHFWCATWADYFWQWTNNWKYTCKSSKKKKKQNQIDIIECGIKNQLYGIVATYVFLVEALIYLALEFMDSLTVWIPGEHQSRITLATQQLQLNWIYFEVAHELQVPSTSISCKNFQEKIIFISWIDMANKNFSKQEIFSRMERICYWIILLTIKINLF